MPLTEISSEYGYSFFEWKCPETEYESEMKKEPCSDDQACEMMQELLKEPVTRIELKECIQLEDITSIGDINVEISVPWAINRQVGIEVDLTPYYDAVMEELQSFKSRLETILLPIKDQL